MNPLNTDKFSSIIPRSKQRSKSNPKKSANVRSHIIFQGDPAFQQESIDYIPVGRRKKIFDDNQSNILPPDLLINQQALMQHNNRLSNQKSINQNMLSSFDRELAPFQSGIYGNQGRNKKLKFNSLRQETYFEPNNLQTDLHFGIIQEEDINPAFNSSKASQTTQKKGGIAFQSNYPLSANLATNIGGPSIISTSRLPANQNTLPQINFSYQGKQFPNKQVDQVVQSRVERVIPTASKSPPKSKSRSIFLNEGGVLVPKNKIPLHESNYFDFQGGDNQSYHEYEYNPITNGSTVINANQRMKMGQTPQFNQKANSNGKSNEYINQSLINEFKSLQSQTNLNKLKKSISDINKNNPNNASIVSYKSVQKQFQNDRFGSTVLGKSKFEQQKQAGSQNQIPKINESPISKPQQDLIMKVFETIGQKQPNKVDQSNSMSFQENKASMFDQILNDRQSMFNKNKVPPEPVSRKVLDQRRSSIANIKSQGVMNEVHSIHKPTDFISDFNSAPKGTKRNIGISNVTGNQYEKLKNDYDTVHPHHENKQTPLIQSKVKKMQVADYIVENKNDIQTVKNQQYENTAQGKQTKNKKSKKQQRKQKVIIQTHSDDPEDYQDDNQQIDEGSIDEVNSAEQQDSSSDQHYSKRSKRRRWRKQIQKAQNDDELQEFLQKQKQKIQMKQLKEYMGHIPEVKQHLKSKSKKSKSPKNIPPGQELQIKTSHKPIVVQNFDSLTPQQKQLLLSAGINIIGKGQSNNIQPAKSQPFMSHVQGLFGNQSNQPFNNPPHYFSHENKKETQLIGNTLGFVNGLQNQHNNQGAHHAHYHQNPQEVEHKFDQINKRLYQELNKFLFTMSLNNQKQSTENKIQIGTYLTEKNHKKINTQIHQQIGSAISFKNQDQNQFISQKNQGDFNKLNQRASQSDFQRKSHHHSNREQINPYSPRIYNELKRYNERKSFSKQKGRIRTQQSPNDQTHYYSFYHDDNSEGRSFISPPKNQLIIDSDGYYPVRLKQGHFSKEPTNSLRAKFDIRNKFSSSELELLYKKIQQLTKQIHQQLPSIRNEIEQNLQQIRKIQTNLLIRNTAQQHTLIKILQKMKLKDVELKQKELQAYNKDQQLSMYQYELDQLKHEFYGQNQLVKDIEMEDFFEKRLLKIKNYNENLCSKIAHAKSHRSALHEPIIKY